MGCTISDEDVKWATKVVDDFEKERGGRYILYNKAHPYQMPRWEADKVPSCNVMFASLVWMIAKLQRRI